jgi:hypothetical protein
LTFIEDIDADGRGRPSQDCGGHGCAQHSKGQSSWFSRRLDRVQRGLVASMAMDGTAVEIAASWVPDLLNAGISGARGDWEGAALSAAAAIPVLGNVANAARFGRSLAKSADKVNDAGPHAHALGGWGGRGGVDLDQGSLS